MLVLIYKNNLDHLLIQKVELHSKVLRYLLCIVSEESIPVDIKVGAKHKDYNGDIQVDVLLEYEEKDKNWVGVAITKATNMAIDFISSNVS